MRGKKIAGRKRVYIALCMCLLGVGTAGCGAAGQGDDAKAVEEKTTETSEDEKTLPESGTEAGNDMTSMPDVSETAEAADNTDTPETAGAEGRSFQGLSLSILGDSLSTYEGWIPNECTDFFPMNGTLTDVSETWWMKVLNATGMELCSNNSSAGCTCAGDSLLTGEVQYGCSTDRISLLTGSQGRMPDVIIVFMGTNDLAKGVPLGNNDGTGLVEEGEVDNFSDAYTLILDKLASEYPMAQIYCCGLHPIGDWGTEQQPFVLLTTHDGLTAEDFTKRIELIAGNKGLPYIDLYHCGIEVDNLHILTSDGVHYTPEGMNYVAQAVLECMNGSGNE